MEQSSRHACDLLRDSLGEAQATVRSYDTKAQIVGVGYIFALGIVGRISEALGRTSAVDIAYIMVAWGIVILPIILFGFVLYPSRKTAPPLSDEPAEQLEHVLYIDPRRHSGVRELVQAAQRADPVSELAFELMKISKLRELKRQRFLRALFAAGISFLVLFAAQLIQSVTAA